MRHKLQSATLGRVMQEREVWEPTRLCGAASGRWYASSWPESGRRARPLSGFRSLCCWPPQCRMCERSTGTSTVDGACSDEHDSEGLNAGHECDDCERNRDYWHVLRTGYDEYITSDVLGTHAAHLPAHFVPAPGRLARQGRSRPSMLRLKNGTACSHLRTVGIELRTLC